MGLYVECKDCGHKNPRGTLECGVCEMTLVELSPVSPVIIAVASALASLASWWLTAKAAPEMLILGPGVLIASFIGPFFVMIISGIFGAVERKACMGAAIGAAVGVTGFMVIAGEFLLTFALSGFIVGLITSVCAHYIMEKRA